MPVTAKCNNNNGSGSSRPKTTYNNNCKETAETSSSGHHYGFYIHVGNTVNVNGITRHVRCRTFPINFKLTDHRLLLDQNIELS